MFSWNAYLWPLIVLTEQNKRTLPIILTWYSSHHSAQNNLIMAASVLMVIPVLIVFALRRSGSFAASRSRVGGRRAWRRSRSSA